mmetsp:Transcript_5785/g.14060  ORF Transcript_5785/g.14060 Transcript_5785/m.14060 type:complete len:250 (-) Transcript_5785:90-839(-)
MLAQRLNTIPRLRVPELNRLSSLAVASHFPSGEKSTSLTLPECPFPTYPFMVFKISPVPASHNLANASVPRKDFASSAMQPVATIAPSGEKHAAFTHGDLSPGGRRSFRTDAPSALASQISATPSQQAVTTSDASGENRASKRPSCAAKVAMQRPSATSQIFAVWSFGEAVTTRLPSREKFAELTQPEWLWAVGFPRVWTFLKDSVSQSSALPSSEEVTRRRSFGEKATDRTGWKCPFKLWTEEFVARE